MSDEIPIKCNCGRFFEVPAELAGMETVCPGCDTSIRVPRTSRLSTAEMPKLKGSSEDHDFLAFDKLGEMIEETILDKPITEVIRTQSQLADARPSTDSQVEIAPEKDERYCAKCRNIIPKNTQVCEKCRALYCTNCGKGMKIGLERCPHCKYHHWTPMPEKGWSRKERPFACKKCDALPAEKVPYCYSCGKPFKEEKKDAWPAAPSVQSSGATLATSRVIRRHGRDGMSLGLTGLVVGFVGVAIGASWISPRSELGGVAWLVLVWASVISLAGRGGYLGWRAYRSPGEEKWSAIGAMIVCGLFFLGPLMPYVVLPTVKEGRTEEEVEECALKLQTIGDALKKYRSEHDQELPPLHGGKFFAELSAYLEDKVNGLRCPGADLSVGYECYEDPSEQLPYGVLAQLGRSFPIAWDIQGHGEIRNVLFLDGHVEQLDEDRFRELLRNAKDEVARSREAEEGDG